MNRLYLSTLFCAFTLFCVAQKPEKFVNLNPDPKGEPWIIGGYTPIPESQILSLEEVKELQKKYQSQHNCQTRTTRALPAMVDNSANQYMRPVFSQKGGSCGSSSRISYMLAYELNCYRRLPGREYKNMYPSHFTWLLTDQNSSKEHMARDNGVPNAVVYGGDKVSEIYGGDVYWPNLQNAPDYGWMQGYDKWYSAMHNRIERSGTFDLNSEEALILLKEWLDNHWGDTDFPAGGIAGTGCASNGMTSVRSTMGDLLVSGWGPTADHAITIVGYDDNVAYDFNGDGKITNNIDTNGDGVVDFRDWEKGALILRNSWGTGWGNEGNIFLPYRLIHHHKAELYFIRKDYKPRRTMKITMNYDARSEIKISVGISADLEATTPEKTIACHHFIFAGNGKVPMLGRWTDKEMHTEDMEFGYDITELTENFDATQPLKYFLQIETKSDATGKGSVTRMSVLNYDTDNPTETISDQKNTAIANAGNTTYVSVIMPGGKAIPAKYISSKNWTVINFDSEEVNGEGPNNGRAIHAIDGNPGTFWHTQWQGAKPAHPHYITVDMGKEYTVSEFEYVPRSGNANGTVAKYQLFVSNDPNSWGDPVSEGTWSKSSLEKRAKFPKTTARYFKFVALSEINGQVFTSAAELRFLNNHAAESSINERAVDTKIWYAARQMNFANLSYPATMQIINLQGQTVMQRKIDANTPSVSITLNPGIYVVKLEIANGKTVTQKIVVK